MVQYDLQTLSPVTEETVFSLVMVDGVAPHPSTLDCRERRLGMTLYFITEIEGFDIRHNDWRVSWENFTGELDIRCPSLILWCEINLITSRLSICSEEEHIMDVDLHTGEYFFSIPGQY